MTRFGRALGLRRGRTGRGGTAVPAPQKLPQEWKQDYKYVCNPLLIPNVNNTDTNPTMPM
jgi:hypothetical protein